MITRHREDFESVRSLYDAMTEDERETCMVAGMRTMPAHRKQCIYNQFFCCVLAELRERKTGSTHPFPI